MIKCVILGAGGHAAVLVDLIGCSGAAEIAGLLDADSNRWKTDVMGFPILGSDEMLPDLRAKGVTHFAVGAGKVDGASTLRRMLFEKGRAAGLAPLPLVHPTAIVSKSARLGEGVQLLPGCIVNARTRIGSNVIVNSGAIVEHDCSIGDDAHIATGAVIAGGVTVGAGAMIGAGATVRQGLVIGEGAVVGAGAVVVKDVPPRIVVAGVPAVAMQSRR